MNEDERSPRESTEPSEPDAEEERGESRAETDATPSEDAVAPGEADASGEADANDADASNEADASGVADASDEADDAKEARASDDAKQAAAEGAGEANASNETSAADADAPSPKDADATSVDAEGSAKAPEDTAATLEAEAKAAREAVEEANEPEPPRYPPPDARTQKLAGWGCIFLLLTVTIGFVVVFRFAFLRLTALDTNMNGFEITTAPASETRRADRDPNVRAHTTAPAGGGVEWRTDLEEAFREARRTERPLLLHFEARWAQASRDMLEGTYANVTVREALASFVPVRIDLSERDASEEELTRRYLVQGLPHVVYVAPDGQRLRPDSKTLVDASDMEVFLQEALGAWQDGRRYVDAPPDPYADEAPSNESPSNEAPSNEAPSNESP